MKGLLIKVLIVAALVAAVAVPAAAAKSHAVKLSLVPLQNAQLGSAGKALPLLRDSGVVSDAEAANNTVSAQASVFVKLGRVSGYALDYGDVYGSGSGVAEIQTGVEKYKTSADAKKGLAFWKKDDAQEVSVLSKAGLPDTGGSFAAPKLGTARFGFVHTVGVAGLAPLAKGDIEVADANYVLDVQVSSSSASTAKSLAAKLAKTLDARLRLAQAGKLHAKPATLPAKRQAGPPAGGPDLGTAALTTSDFTGSATSLNSGYGIDPMAISEYEADFAPAGQFDAVNQVVEWYPTAGDATFLANLEQALLTVGIAHSGAATPVDLSSVGDDAQGVLLQATGGGSTVYVALVTLSRGQALDIAAAASASAIQTSEVQSLAQAMASHLDAAVSG